jgi:hypothetical protein
LNETIEQTREILRKSLELLSQPVPDTFLGRHTHEPFAPEDRDLSSQIMRWQRPHT